MLKTVGTYNALWMMRVAEAHQRAKEQQRRYRVVLNGGYPLLFSLMPGPLTLKDVR